MSIRLLKTLIAVADHKTFGAAADAVFLTHAAVSQQMRALEADLGLVLFDRTRRTPELSPIGRALVARARKLVAEYDNLVPAILSDVGFQGELNVGAVPTTLTGLAPAAMSIMRATYSGLLLRIHPALTSALLTGIERGTLDVALVTKPVILPIGLKFLEIAQEPLCLVTSAQIREKDPAQILQEHPFIRYNREAVVGTLIEHWLQNTATRVTEVMELENLEAISSMVYANLGVSIVPAPCVANPGALPLRWLPLGEDAPRRVLGLVYAKDTLKLRVIEELHAACLSAAKAATPA
jgi:DNA-binding transcriptional LysR family regulator